MEERNEMTTQQKFCLDILRQLNNTLDILCSLPKKEFARMNIQNKINETVNEINNIAGVSIEYTTGKRIL